MTDKIRKRAKLTGVTLSILDPDGTPRNITLDPKHATGLFWSDETVLQIFAPYYDNAQSEMTKDELINRFGPEAEKIVGKSPNIKITKNVVEELWNLPDPNGHLRAFMIKTNDCYPG